ncbi:MAG TPA: methylmalonyl-CoA mutase subunit beta [Streptosporangiaceae bacterium]
MTVSEEATAEFPAAGREQWQHLVEGVLAKSGRPGLAGPEAERALATEVEDGLWIQPLYTAEDTSADPGWPGFAPFVRGGHAQGSGTGVSGWDVRQQHAHPDPRRTNEAVLADLENGVTSLWLRLGGSGLPVAALPDALDGVYLDLAGVVLDAGADFAAAAERLLGLYGNGPGRDGHGNLGADPLGSLARTGQDTGTARQLAEAARLAARCASEFPGVRALTVDALPYHDAGASAAQELALSLSTAVAYLRVLTGSGLAGSGLTGSGLTGSGLAGSGLTGSGLAESGLAGSGLTADQAAGQLEFRYAASADQFLTIAKLRAARRLWSRVAQVCGVGPAGAAQRQHAVTSTVMMTERDPWVNMLRTTVACLAAGLGGADAITVLPFDSALGLPDNFARRIARNTQAILLDEVNLARVIDPAGGSWYVERLTDQLASAAWDWFQQIERAGGHRAALDSGLIAERIAQNWAERSAKLARRREPITGVSEFPNLGERPVVRDPAPAQPGGGLPRVHRADAFEALRSRSDALLAATGARPKVLLVTLGPVAVYTARSTFAANLFQAGGVETILSETAEPSRKALEEAVQASGARAACICSSDAIYTEHAEAAAAALKAAGARYVVLAGRPAPYQNIDDFVYLGGDAIAALTAVYDEIGASS